MNNSMTENVIFSYASMSSGSFSDFGGTLTVSPLPMIPISHFR